MKRYSHALLTLPCWATRAFGYRAGPLMGVVGRIAFTDAAVRRRRAP